VFVDGGQEAKDSCFVLPGGDAPERVVFEALGDINWAKLHERLNRNYSDVADACKQAMTYTDHHEWVRSAADRLLLSSIVLWQAMRQCAVNGPETVSAQSKLIRSSRLSKQH
jgi:hypothetical protein